MSHYAAWEWDNEEHRICATNAVKTPNKIWNVSVAYNETNHLLKPTQNSTSMFYGDVKITVNMIVTQSQGEHINSLYELPSTFLC